MGSGTNKIWLEFYGHSVLEWTLRHFQEAGIVRGVVVSRPDDQERIHTLLSGYELDKMRTAIGGSERYLSVVEGLQALSGVESEDIVLVHDAARFLVPKPVIQRVAAAAREVGAAVPVIEVVDTVKEIQGGARIVRTVARDTLRLAQTPQGFLVSVLNHAYQIWTGGVPTDDAEVVEKAGYPVAVVEGDRFNQKLTRAEDIPWFEENIRTFSFQGINIAKRAGKKGVNEDANRSGV